VRTVPFLLATILALTLLAAGCATQETSDAIDPDTVSAKDAARFNVQLGLAYLQQGKVELARDKLERALKQNPRDPSVHTAVALLYDRLGDDRKAEQHFRTALRMRPGDPSVQNYYGVFLCKSRRYRDGEKALLKAAASPLYQTPEVALSNAGVCERSAGHLDAAENYFRRATELRPLFAEGWLQLAEVKFMRKDYPAARSCLQRHFDLAHVSATALWLGLRIEKAVGNKPQADAYGRRLKAEFPNSDETRLLLQQERKQG
jgi:type IV pilus assembly protein PilF